jgi:predicted metal-dependent hydrolase
MAIAKGLEAFVNINIDSPQRWKSYSPTADSTLFRDEAQKLVATCPEAQSLGFRKLKTFANITDAEASLILEGHSLLNAEAFIFFESLINVAFRRVSRDFKDGEARKAVRKFLREEVLHSRGFRRYLKSEGPLGWPRCSLMIQHNRGLKTLMVKTIEKAPLAICFFAAKIEAYSVSYAQLLRDDYAELGPNPWVHINLMHAQDEGTHVPLQFDLYEHESNNQRGFFAMAVRTPLAGLLIFAAMQFLLISSTYRLIKAVFRKDSVFQNLGRTLAFGRWVVRDFEAYRVARRKTQKLFDERRPRYGWFYRFIYW